MASIKAGLAFLGSIGVTLVIISCVQYGTWWPFFAVLFYLLAPIPTMIVARCSGDSTTPNGSAMDTAIFLTVGIVISSFALPIVLARAPDGDPTINWPACALTLAGNVVVYLTLIGLFITNNSSEYENMW